MTKQQKQKNATNAKTQLVERLQQQITFGDAQEGGMMDATYIRRTTEGGRRVTRTLYPTIFPLHFSVETPFTTERGYVHWVIANTMSPLPHLGEFFSFTPQEGDLFSYTLTYECDDDEDECCFRIVGWSYEDGTDKTIIKLEAEPVSQASYYKEAWLAERFSARTEAEEVPF